MIELDNHVRVRVGGYNDGMMRKIAVCALGVFAFGLASPTVVGQEKPRVQGPQPKVEGRFRWAVGRATGEGVQARVDLNARWVAWSPDGKRIVFDLPSIPEPLMRGPFKAAVEELEKVFEMEGEDDLTKVLRTLDTLEKAAMKARRSLARLKETEGDTLENDGIVAQRAGESWITVRVWNVGDLTQDGPRGRTPLKQAHESLGLAVLSVRQAPDVEGAATALDDVEKSTAALRALLWEKQSSKRN